MKKYLISLPGQVAVIILSASISGVLANWVRPDGLPLKGRWSPEETLRLASGESMAISLDEARELYEKGMAVFIDARSPGDFKKGHIKGALNIPWQSFEQYAHRLAERVPEDAWIITYCDGDICALSGELARELVSMGYQNVWVLVNGWTKWRETGLPTTRGGPVKAQ